MNKNKKIQLIILMILFITFLITQGVTFAKYVYNNVLNYYFKTKEFYFYSDSLDTKEVTNTINNWDGEDLTFNLKNYLNDSLITEYDTSYKIECTTNNPDYTCIVNEKENIYEGVLSSIKTCTDNENNIITSITNMEDCIQNNYEWIPNKTESLINLNVTNNNTIVDNLILNVKVTSTNPYKKELNGKFILTKLDSKEDYSLNVLDYNDYLEVIISNKTNETNNYTLEFDSNKLNIDVTEDLKELRADNNSINKVEFALKENSNLKIVFYKKNNTETFNKDDFKINTIN